MLYPLSYEGRDLSENVSEIHPKPDECHSAGSRQVCGSAACEGCATAASVAGGLVAAGDCWTVRPAALVGQEVRRAGLGRDTVLVEC